MATEQCPTCQRPFKKITDYPRIHLVEFERVGFPSEVKLPIDTLTKPGKGVSHFTEPGVDPNNGLVPAEVVQLFNDPKVRQVDEQTENEFVDHRGLRWTRADDYSSYPGIMVYSVSIDDAKAAILYQFGLTIDRFESYVGHIVSNQQLIIPDLPNHIPGHDRYRLQLMETERTRDLRRAELQVRTSITTVRNSWRALSQGSGIPLARIGYEGLIVD